MDTIGNRLRAVRKEFGFGQNEFGERLGVNQNALSQYENGNRKLPDEIMQKLAEIFDVNINWLLTGKGEMFLCDDDSQTVSNATDEFIQIDFLDSSACAGNGIANFQSEVLGKLPISPELIYPHQPAEVKAIRVKGDSMSPTLASGDVVLFVQGLVNDGNGIYILLHNGELFVKRLHFKMTGVIDIISDNPNYSNEQLTAGSNESPVIIGKVIYQVHKLN